MPIRFKMGDVLEKLPTLAPSIENALHMEGNDY